MGLAMPAKGERLCECPECGTVVRVTDVSRTEYTGGEDYRSFDDIDGVWFEEYSQESLEMAYCSSDFGGCDEDSDWERWTEFDDGWKCNDCGTRYRWKESALDCCA